MKKSIVFFAMFILLSGLNLFAQNDFKKDIIKTKKGDLEITFIGHGALMFKYNNKIIHVDPFSKVADFSKQPKADLLLITHHHGDHLDLKALKEIVVSSTQIVMTKKCQDNTDTLKNTLLMKNGDKKKVMGIKIEAVPAYNIVNKRKEGEPYHPKGVGNGYILTMADKKIYIAGDTENTPEMKALKKIDVAFLPMNLPYTMTPEMVADAAKAFQPKILYPYHYSKTDTNELVELLKNEKSIEVRIRKM